jgi:hypothetical protein
LITQLYRLAWRISYNRIVAGVHFRCDLIAGARLGIAIADHVVRLGRMPDTNVGSIPVAFVANDDDGQARDQLEQLAVTDEVSKVAPTSALVHYAFKCALEEWKNHLDGKR